MGEGKTDLNASNPSEELQCKVAMWVIGGAVKSEKRSSSAVAESSPSECDSQGSEMGFSDKGHSGGGAE